MPEREIVKEFLKCILTEGEKREIAQNLAVAVMSRDEAEGGLKSAQTQFKSKIALHEAELISLAEKLRSGFEMRNIECEISGDYKLGTVTIIRLDTGEIIRERPMTKDERQNKLF